MGLGGFDGCGHRFGGCDGLGGLGGLNGLSGFCGFDGLDRFGGFGGFNGFSRFDGFGGFGGFVFQSIFRSPRLFLKRRGLLLLLMLVTFSCLTER